MRENGNIVVVGCGGLGGVVAAHLAELDLRVTVVSRNASTAAAIAERGLRLRGEGSERSIPLRVVPSVPQGPFDLAILATQPPDVEAAAQAVVPALTPAGRIVCLQNGLCEQRVAAAIGAPERVVGAVVTWGATMIEPGYCDRTSAGGFVIGRYSGPADAQLHELATMLESIGPVRISENLTGARWSKLAINCAISALGTLSGERLGPLVRSRPVRRVALEVISEAVAVAKRLGVVLEPVAGSLDLEKLTLNQQQRRSGVGSVALAGKHTVLLAVGLRYRRLRSSMLAAIERGREPPIDFVNGEVVAAGRRLELATPYNERICEQVWRIAAGELTPSRQHVLELLN